MGRLGTIIGGTFYAGVLGLALLGGTAAGYIGRSSMMSQLLRDAIIPPKPQEVFKEGDSLTLLLLGCDEDRWPAGPLRADGTRGRGTTLNGSSVRRKYGRSDMILVARLDFAKNRITGVSVPRDVWAELPGYGRRKINAFHSIAPEKEANETTKRAIERLLPGVHIDRTIALNYDAFKAMVDRVGGVKVDIPKKMDYDDHAGDLHIHFEKGIKNLTGEEAMGYVRFRHDAESDFGRQARQKEFLSAFKGSVMQNPAALADVAELGVQVMNGVLDEREISALAMFSRGLGPEGIKLGMIPVRNGRKRSTLLVDEDKLPGVLREYGLITGREARR